MDNTDDKIVQFLKRIDDAKTDKQILKITRRVVDYYLVKEQYILSKEWGGKLLDKAKEMDNIDNIIYGYFVIGKSYMELDLFNQALEYLSTVYKMGVEKKDNEVIALAMNMIGVVYGRLKNIDKALELMLEAVSLSNEQPCLLINIGNIYSQKNDYKKALEYLKKGLQNAKDPEGVAETLIASIHIAFTYLKMKEHDKSSRIFKKLLHTNKSDMYYRAKTYVGLSRACWAKNLSDEAKENLAYAIDLIGQIELNSSLLDIYQMISETFEMMGDSDNSLCFYKKYTELIQSIFDDKLAHNLAQVQENFDREKKELEKQYQQQLNLTEKELKKQIELFRNLYADVAGLNTFGFFSDTMDKIYSLCKKLHEDRNISVLIEGETGTGKEIIARLIHYGNENTTVPFISINCSAISPALFESELFGYEGGAFTGSKLKGMQGKLELAQGGTLFLDEIGDMPLDMQPKLLRVLQEKEIYRIGGVKKIALDVRIICATNQDLCELIKRGSFRKDLYYRLNTGHIRIPPLRERKEEIIPLARMFLEYFSKQKKKKFTKISLGAEKLLEKKEWEGNVRELENIIERAVMLYDDDILQEHHLLNEFSANDQSWQTENSILISLKQENSPLKDMEKEIIEQLLKRFNGNISRTADYLDITRKTLKSKLKK